MSVIGLTPDKSDLRDMGNEYKVHRGELGRDRDNVFCAVCSHRLISVVFIGRSQANGCPMVLDVLLCNQRDMCSEVACSNHAR